MVIGGVHLIVPFYFLNDRLELLAREINCVQKKEKKTSLGADKEKNQTCVEKRIGLALGFLFGEADRKRATARRRVTDGEEGES
jgi:hypothetical protein